MLTVTALTNAEYVLSSVALGIDEYYTGVGEAAGVWAGGWSVALGLEGMVEADALRALVDGNHPISGVPLLVGLRERSIKAFDLTFSAPKSVSVVWALASERVADVVSGAHREAVAVAVEFLEGRAAVARVQVDGIRRHVSTDGWAVAGFVHRTSRAGDPQLHTHCVVPNVVRREDGRCVAIAARPLFVWARAAGSVYQAELQRLLSLRLGVEWQPDRNNTREIAGFDVQTLRGFSKRTVEIEAELEAAGARYQSPGLRTRADDEASLATRPAKNHTATPQMLFDRWHSEAHELGLPVGWDLEQSVCWRDPPLASIGFDEVARRLVDEETGLCAHDARFAEHDVIEHVAGLAAGRLSTTEIVGLAREFLGSGLVCRLAPKATASRWEPARWSTVVHRRLEDDTVRLVDRLAAIPAAPVGEAVVDDGVAAVGFLGADQAAAVRTLCGPGGSVRAVLAPAGYGKTAMAYVAAGCAAADGRPVLAVATTAKAVAELDAAGLAAQTIASFRLDLVQRPLPAGTVVILDEISQTSTRDAHTVLTALADCPGGQLWVLGDPLQAPAVKAGGIAAEIDTRAATKAIPAAELTVNRRQLDPIDRRALNILRCGDPHTSQQVRRDHGWEHTGATPEATRQAMAEAVAADIIHAGPENTVALVISHAQAEDLADRIRDRLVTAGALGGKSITAPGWTSDRHYQPGDRILLHTRHGDRRSPLINGTVGTITAVDAAGVAFSPDRGRPLILPASFVQGTKPDASPNVSHAWARTVDGAQGGTWEHVHLLGTATLDAYRGYTAQSRSRQPTHTWNSATIPTIDYGGRLAHRPDPDDQVVAALGRVPDTTMAAVDDPWIVDDQLRRMIAAHQAKLDRQPPDRQQQLEAAHQTLVAARTRLAAAENAVTATRDKLDNLGAFVGLTVGGRAQRRALNADLQSRHGGAVEAAGDVAGAEARVERFRLDQAAHDAHERAHGWCREAIERAWDCLDQHWTDVALACVRADQPLAYGVDPLRIARHHLNDQLAVLQATIPPDQSRDRDAARKELAKAVRGRHEAHRSVTAAQAELDQQAARRWPRRDRSAIDRCSQQLDSARNHLAAVRQLEDRATCRVDDLVQHQRARATALAATAGERHTLAGGIEHIDSALDRTHTQRVVQLADQPTNLHLEVLGPVPTGPAGRAVWCHHASRLEHHLDYTTGHDSSWSTLVHELSDTPELAHFAERHIPVHASSVEQRDTWRQITEHATALRTATMEHSRHIPRPPDLGLGLEL